MQLHISGADYLAAIRLALRPRKSWAIAGFVLLLFVGWGAALIVISVLSGKGGAMEYVLLLCLAYLPFWYFVVLPWRVRKLYVQRHDLQEQYEFSFDDEGISLSSSLLNQRFPWSHTRKWRESRELFLVYIADNMFKVFPKRSFVSSVEIDCFRELLTKNAGPGFGSYKPKRLPNA